MKSYRNLYFKIALGFEENWKVRSWHNRKTAPASPELHQCSDDDLPKTDGSWKGLFLAMCLIKESPEIMSCQCSMEVHLHNNRFDLKKRLPPTSEEASRDFQNLSVLGKEAQSLETSYNMENYVLRQKVIIWEALPSIWLSACIRGDTISNYNNALRQFNTLENVV